MSHRGWVLGHGYEHQLDDAGRLACPHVQQRAVVNESGVERHEAGPLEIRIRREVRFDQRLLVRASHAGAASASSNSLKSRRYGSTSADLASEITRTPCYDAFAAASRRFRSSLIQS